MAEETTLIIVKPDGVERGLVGAMLSRFEAAGFGLVAATSLKLTRDQAKSFYAEHTEKPFFPNLVQYIASGRIVVVAVRREDAIRRARQLIGATNPPDAAPGSIRADYGLDNTRNTVHASDSPASARREVAFFFPDLD
jgi:nucleoside-diphosphate kinase